MCSKVLPDAPTCWVSWAKDADLDDVAANGEDVHNVPDAGAGDGEGGGDDCPGVTAGSLLRGGRQFRDPPHLRPLLVDLQQGGVVMDSGGHLAPVQSQPLDRLVG